MPQHVANIIGPSGAILFRVESFGLSCSCSVPGLRYEDKRGKVTAVNGCRDEREALRVSKQIGKKLWRRYEEQGRATMPFPNPSLWRLHLLPLL